MVVTYPINFKDISVKTGVRKGKIFYSDFAKSWVVSGSKDVDLICIDPPFKEGDYILGRAITSVKIQSNKWVFNLQ